MKVCCRCKSEKPYGEFGKSKNRRDGHHPMCKGCRKVEAAERLEKDRPRRQAYYAANREPWLAADKARRMARSPEQLARDRARSAQYYADHRDELNARNREYQRTHKKELAAS